MVVMLESEPTHYIGLVDCNNFFVSCERLFRPDLQRRPVLVLSSNDGCVVARSQEVKDMGIPMGVPLFQIKDIVKDKQITLFSSNFTLYRDISRRVFSVVRGICPEFEQYSIDEGFFVVPRAQAERVGSLIRDTVARTLGMPVSVGLAPSKTLAKHASKLAKRAGGVQVLTVPIWQTRADSVGLGELWGVGSRRAQAFAAADLSTAIDLISADPGLVRRRFGVEGARLQLELRGVSAYPVTTARKQQQSIMHSRSFRATTKKHAVVAEAVAYHLRRGVEDLVEMGLCAQYLTVSIRSSRYETQAPGWGSETVLLSPATADVFVLLREAMGALARLYRPEVAYQKAGIVLSGLMPQEMVAADTLWGSTAADAKYRAVHEAVGHLNRRWGNDAVQIGYYAPSTSWRARQDVLSPAYTTRWSDVALVRAG